MRWSGSGCLGREAGLKLLQSCEPWQRLMLFTNEAVRRKNDLNQSIRPLENKKMVWPPISIEAFDRDLEMAVRHCGELQVLVFPCRRILEGRVKAATKERSCVSPTPTTKTRASAASKSLAARPVACSVSSNGCIK